MNRIYLDKIKDKNTGEGFTLFDDYANDTQFVTEGVPDADLELLRLVVRNCDGTGSDILQFCNEEERGITINNVWYPYKDIEHIINP